jgi:hypothetical protein
MIVTEFYKGQGLGNQLWCYATTRIIALERGYDFGIQSPERFKGLELMDLDFGSPVIGGTGPEGGPPDTLPQGIAGYYAERSAIHIPSGSDVRMRDERLISVPDNTKIDGYLQDAAYLEGWKPHIKKWFAIRKEAECIDYASDDICVINFRGGTYIYDADFFLRKEYWDHAIANMRKINPRFTFVVITEDVPTAKRFFPDFDVFHFSVAKDYSVIKNAHYLILSNSSFAWFPAWLSDRLKLCIAPKYWGRHNKSDGYWSLGYAITEGWQYQDREGRLFDAETCTAELNDYLQRHTDEIEYAPQDSVPEHPPPVLQKPFRRLSMAGMIFSRTWRYRSPAQALQKVLTAAVKAVSTVSRALMKRANRALDACIEGTGSLFHLQSERIQAIRNAKSDIPAFLVRKTAQLTDPLFLRIRERRSKRGWLANERISEYRKTIRVYDAFTFFNELDLLEIRLNILDPYVDYFVLLEAAKTYSGDPKPLYYAENKERFAKWNKKILHYVVDDVPSNVDDLRKVLYRRTSEVDPLDRQIAIDALLTDNTGNGEMEWFREFYIKEHLKKALAQARLNDDDICYISDLDEIWNPDLVIDYSKKDEVFKLIQKGYTYYLNNRNDERWTGWSGTIVTAYRNIRYQCLNHLRTYGKMKDRYSFLRNGGWHFTFQGGYAGAKRKIEESNHFWYNPEEVLPHLKMRVLKNRDHKGRNIRLWKDERGLPKYLLAHKEKYREFFR